MKSNSLEFESTLSVQQLGQALNSSYSKLRANVEPVEASSNPLDSMSGSPDIAVVGIARGVIGGAWGVHAYVSDMGPHRHVELVAIGDSGFSRAFNGIRNTISLGKSSEKMAAIAADLQAADRGLRTL
jgi:hypothetical protein